MADKQTESKRRQRIKWFSKFDSAFDQIFYDESNYDVQTYKKMEDDSVIAAILRSIKLPILGATWDIVPPTGADDRDNQVSEILREAFFEYLDWEEILEDILHFPTFGSIVLQRIYRLRNIEGKQYLLPEDFIPAPVGTIKEQPGQSRDNNGRLIRLFQEIDGETRPISREELVIVAFDKRNKHDWKGKSILRPLVMDWLKRDALVDFMNKSIEKYGLGILVFTDSPIEVDKETGEQLDDNDDDEETREEIKESLENLHSGGSYFYQRGEQKIELLKNESNYQDMLQAIQYYNTNMIRSVAANHLLLGLQPGTSGTNALGVTLSENFLQIVKSIASAIPLAFNKVIKELVKINWPDRKKFPKLVVNDIQGSSSDDQFKLAQYGLLAPTIELLQKNLETVGVRSTVESIKESIKRMNNTPTPRSTEENKKEEENDEGREEENNDNQES